MREYLLSNSAQKILALHRSPEFQQLDLSDQLPLRTLDHELLELARYFESLDEINDTYKKMCHDFFYRMFTTCDRDDSIAYFRLAVADYRLRVWAESSVDEFVYKIQPRVDRLCGSG
jgi:hypothetical protein